MFFTIYHVNYSTIIRSKQDCKAAIFSKSCESGVDADRSALISSPADNSDKVTGVHLAAAKQLLAQISAAESANPAIRHSTLAAQTLPSHALPQSAARRITADAWPQHTSPHCHQPVN